MVSVSLKAEVMVLFAYLANFNFHRIVIHRKAHTPDTFGDKCMHSRKMTNTCWELNVEVFCFFYAPF